MRLCPWVYTNARVPVRTSTNMPLKVSLVYADDKAPVKATGAQALVRAVCSCPCGVNACGALTNPTLALQSVERAQDAVIGASGMVQIKVKIHEVSMSHQNRSFRICVEPTKPVKGVDVQPVYSDATTVMYVVRA